MLKIFKDYPYETSILDDFNFYETKQDNQSTIKISPTGEVQMDTSLNQDQENEFMQMNNPNFMPENTNPSGNFMKVKNQNPMQNVNQFPMNNMNQMNMNNMNPNFFNQNPNPKKIIKRINSTENLVKNTKRDENYDNDDEDN